MVNRGVNKVGPALKTPEGAHQLARGTVGLGLGAQVWRGMCFGGLGGVVVGWWSGFLIANTWHLCDWQQATWWRKHELCAPQNEQPRGSGAFSFSDVLMDRHG